MTDHPESPVTTAAVHNVRHRDQQSSSGDAARELFLSVDHARPGERLRDSDVEGAVLIVDSHDVIVATEAGDRFVFDLTELRAALAA